MPCDAASLLGDLGAGIRREASDYTQVKCWSCCGYGAQDVKS